MQHNFPVGYISNCIFLPSFTKNQFKEKESQPNTRLTTYNILNLGFETFNS